jgi:hypothetical protein
LSLIVGKKNRTERKRVEVGRRETLIYEGSRRGGTASEVFGRRCQRAAPILFSSWSSVKLITGLKWRGKQAGEIQDQTPLIYANC